MTTARVLLRTGRISDAINHLPLGEQLGDERFVSLFVWAEACLAAGEKNLAANYLRKVQSSLVTMPLPQRQSKFDLLVQQL